ncbi:MAG: PhnD/SsuA/transferrin family substrate-binding protein [Pseudomonadota bacterium]
MTLTRRKFLGACAVLAMTPPRPAFSAKALRVGMTPAFLHTQYGLLAEWRGYMEAKLNRPVEIVQRDSYRESMDLLRLEQLDFAWICTYPYVYLRKELRLVAVPLYRSRPFYRAYLIVSAKNRHIKSLSQLRGRVFAYADPYSLTGHLVPRYELRKMGEDPERFFSKTFFTYSHSKLIQAVAEGLAHGGSVDSYVWDSLNELNPEVTGRTFLVSKSPDFGFPPFVARRAVAEEDFVAVQTMLIGMRQDQQGNALLQHLNLNGFIHGIPDLYDGVAKMIREFGEG